MFGLTLHFFAKAPAHNITLHVCPQECFESLLKLLNWSWNTFCVAVVEVQGMKGTSLTAALLDLERLVYISTASLRLTKVYVNEVYPIHGESMLSM